MSGLITKLIEFCDRMIITSNEDIVLESNQLRPELRGNNNAPLRKKMDNAIHDLLEKIHTNKDDCLGHAIKKHKDRDAAIKHDNHEDPISYFDTGIDVEKAAYGSIKKGNIQIKNQLVQGNQSITLCAPYSQNIGFAKENKKAKNSEDANEFKPTSYVRLGITNKSNKSGTYDLSLDSVYPIPEHVYKSSNPEYKIE